MFNTLAAYILGNSTRNSTDVQSENNHLNTDEINNNLKLITTCCEDEEDDDWLLVEKGEGDSSSQTDSEDEIPFIEIKNNPIVRNRHSRNNSNVGSQDGAFSLLPSSPIPNCMDESWFVTPPPCFTSTGPINVETSPLENLLIEHPSMSVYHSIRSSVPHSTAVMNETEEHDGMILVNVNLNPEAEIRVLPLTGRGGGQMRRHRVDNNNNNNNNHHHHHHHHHHHIDTLTAQQVKQVVALKHSQKAHEKKNRQQMCRNAIDRNNKVREVNSKGGRQRRSDMTHCKVISRANNNRKC